MGILKQRGVQALARPLVQSGPGFCRSQVILGSPKAGCNGLGICRMYLTTKRISTVCTVIHARLSIQVNGRLRISFIKASMSRGYLKKHFRWHLFPVPEAFGLPGWAQRKLQLTQTEIGPGVYAVWETEEMMIVDF